MVVVRELCRGWIYWVSPMVSPLPVANLYKTFLVSTIHSILLLLVGGPNESHLTIDVGTDQRQRPVIYRIALVGTHGRRPRRRNGKRAIVRSNVIGTNHSAITLIIKLLAKKLDLSGSLSVNPCDRLSKAWAVGNSWWKVSFQPVPLVCD